MVFAISGNDTLNLYDTGGSAFPLSGQNLSTSTAPSISSVSTGCDKTMLVMAAYSGTTAAGPADQTAGTSFTIILNQARKPARITRRQPHSRK
jgi:hypothetical protein